ncbi:MAG: Hsp20/alpha crystallin family protein [Flavobacteriales bacterium]
MKDRKIQIAREALIQGDAMNTLNGGMSLPSVDVQAHSDHYMVDACVPGVSADSLKVDVEGDRLVIARTIDVKAGSDSGMPIKAENLIHVLPIPNDVDLEGIRANYDKKGLHIMLPHNAFAKGYRKRVDIER